MSWTRRQAIKGERRGSRARRERMREGKRQRYPSGPIITRGQWKGWREMGAIEDQPPPTFRPTLPGTEVGRRLKDFHREHPGLGRRGYSADFYILDEPWRYDA